MITKTQQLDTEALILAGEGYQLTISPEAEVRKQQILAGSATIVQVTSNDESGVARSHLARLAQMRIEVEKSRKALNEPLNRTKKLIDAAAKSFTESFEMEESRIRALIGNHASEVARLKAAAEAEERKAFEFARAAREQAEETGRIADVLAMRNAVAAKLASSNEVATTKIAQGVRFAWDFEVFDLGAIYMNAPGLCEVTAKRSAILDWLKATEAENDLDPVLAAAAIGIRAFRKPVVTAR